MAVKVSIILPARNEAESLQELLPALGKRFPDAEILVVDDGSTDATFQVCKECGVRVLQHPESLGNGAAVKSGARAAGGDTLVFMDADGQHRPEHAAALLDAFRDGDCAMVVGARAGAAQANWARRLANLCYSALAGWMVGRRVHDLTSGLRVVDAVRFREFLYLLPNGFSYPSSITMAFFRCGYPVRYVRADVQPRKANRSHVRMMRDGPVFLLVMLRVCTLYAPLKIFAPVSLVLFVLGLFRYLYTYLLHDRFTNMSLLLWLCATLVILLGLISEQITLLLYSRGAHFRPVTGADGGEATAAERLPGQTGTRPAPRAPAR